MNIRTYIFGNPDGWKLYNKDQSEINYFKSFYVNSRRGPRLMVNRRDDGSVIYIWLMYGISEIRSDKNTEQKRGGYGHLGMALVLDNYQFTPEFGMVYRFFLQLFEKLLQRPDSPIMVLDNGELPYAYKISKFEEAESAVEWLRTMMPRILDKTGVKSMSDYDFTDGSTGKTISLSDETSDRKILSAFQRNNWVAVSPEFRESHSPDGETRNVGREEINLYEISMLQIRLSNQFHEYSSIPNEIKRRELLQKIMAIANNQRAVLASYVNKRGVETDDVVKVRTLQSAFSNLASQIDSILSSTGSSSGDGSGTDSGGSSNPNPSTDPFVIRVWKILKSVPPKLLAVCIVVLCIVILIITLNKFRADGIVEFSAPEYNDTVINESPDGAVEDTENKDFIQFNAAIASQRFTDAYAISKVRGGEYPQKLLNAVTEHLWSLVNSDDEGAITSFFIQNDEICKYLGLGEKEGITWGTKAARHKELSGYLSKRTLTKSEYKKAEFLANEIEEGRYNDDLADLKNRVNQPDENRGAIEQKNITVTCGGDVKTTDGTKPVAFTIKLKENKNKPIEIKINRIRETMAINGE